MRFVVLLGTLCASLGIAAENPAAQLWDESQAKRGKLPAYHQEFDVSRTFKLSSGDQGSVRKLVIDASQGRWRQAYVSGSGNRVEIFDGEDLLSMDEGGDEYVREKRRSKDEGPAPAPYVLSNANWAKATVVERRPCGFGGNDHTCAVLDVPLKGGVVRLNTGSSATKILEGTERIILDMDTGLLITCRTVESIDNGRNTYQSDTIYTSKRIGYGGAADLSLFRLPSGDMREVKELSKWSASKIKKQLAGKPAPELAVKDLEGKPIALEAFKGKTVLLDFWTTWCPPCRADGPALDKLYSKYGGKELAIVGISVSEDRAIVEKFLKEHPHSYPIVLTSENEMPRAYEIGALPTYVVIAPDGTVTSAAEGDQGFGELRKMLKKAGMDTE